MDNVFIEYLFIGVLKLWLHLPKFVKYATFVLISFAAASYGLYRISMFSAAFIPAIHFTEKREHGIPYSVYALSFLFASLFMTTNNWIFGLGCLLATVTILLMDWYKIKSSWPFAIMFLFFSPLAYYSGHAYWAITYIVFGVLVLVVRTLYSSLSTTTKP